MNPLTRAPVIAILFLLGISSAGAQELEEITVTAQKRAQSLQSVPIAITAIGGEEMREADIHTLDDIAVKTPGFFMGSFNKGQPQLYIRGIGSNADGAGSDVSVVTFLDEVYIGRASGSVFDLFDLDRVEVLRGPQGTLFGKNAIGGAVSMITSKPSETFYGRAELSLGNLNAVVARALVSGPISDNVFGKVSASFRSRDGFVESVTTGQKMSDQGNGGIRGTLLFTPREDVEVQVTADYNKSEETGAGRILVADNNPATPDILVGIAQAANPAAANDYTKTFADNQGVADVEAGGIMGKVNWDVGSGTFTSITAYRTSDYLNVDDIPAWSLSLGVIDATTFVDESADQFSQEFRFAGTGMDNRLNWVAGVYYLTEDVERQENSEVAVPAVAATSQSFQDNTTDSISAFGDFTYDFSDRFSAVVGARYTSEDKNIRQVGIPPVAFPHTINESYDITASKSWNAFTPRVVLQWQVSDELFFYGSYAEGFKSGGFEGTASSEIAARTPFNQEDAKAFEIGAKMELLNDRLRLNVAGFTTDYTDLQVLVRKPAFPGDPLGVVITENAADATSNGLEIEFDAILSENFEVSGSYTYLDATYDRYLEPNGIDNAGNRLRNAPENAVNLVAKYTKDLAGGAQISVRYDFFHSDEAFQDPREEPGAAKPAYDLSNLRVSYTPANGDWEFAVWGRNLFDEEYLTHNFPLQPFGNPGTAGAPLTYGVSALYDFGQ